MAPAPVCITPVWDVFSLRIEDPLLLLTGVLAALVGVYCGRAVLKLQIRGTLSLSLPFFMFAVMMSEAAATHCLGVPYLPTPVLNAFWLVDAALTSSIACAFAFNALVALRVLDDDKPSNWVPLVAVLAALWYGWYIALFHPASFPNAFNLLYVDVILVCCGGWMLVQLYLLGKSRSAKGLEWVLLGGIAGGVGLYAAGKCEWPTIVFSGQFWWFILSDVSMFALYKFFAARQQQSPMVSRAALHTGPFQSPPPPVPLGLVPAAAHYNVASATAKM